MKGGLVYMDARETLKLISKQWCNLDDLMKLAEIGKNNAVKLRREIKNDLINRGYTLPNNRLPMIEVVNKLKININYLEKMAKEGPSAEHMQKIKEYMLKKYKDAQKENGYWLNNLDEYFYTGIDNTKDYEKLVNSITAKEVQDFLAKLLKQNNEIQVVMTMPEENK